MGFKKNFIKIKYPKGFIPPSDGEILTVTANDFWPEEKSVKYDWDPLTELAKHHGNLDKWGRHFYTPHYNRYFKHLRKNPVKVLELGIGGYEYSDKGGISLRMWKEYFPKGTIVGVDIYDKSPLAEDRIDIVQGGQDDPKLFEKLKETYGEFDIIIDDASHNSEKTIASFLGLWPLLKMDGIYAIEDLQTSYWPQFGGSSEPDRSGTTIEFLKTLVENIQYTEIDLDNYTPTELDKTIVAIEIRKNIAFIQKGDNTGGSIGLPDHPHDIFFTPEKLANPSERIEYPDNIIVPPPVEGIQDEEA